MNGREGRFLALCALLLGAGVLLPFTVLRSVPRLLSGAAGLWILTTLLILAAGWAFTARWGRDEAGRNAG